MDFLKLVYTFFKQTMQRLRITLFWEDRAQNPPPGIFFILICIYFRGKGDQVNWPVVDPFLTPFQLGWFRISDAANLSGTVAYGIPRNWAYGLLSLEAFVGLGKF